MTIQKATRELLGGHTAIRMTTDRGVAFIECPKWWILSQAVILTGGDVADGKIPVVSLDWPARLRESDGGIHADDCTQDTVIVEIARRYMAGDYDAIPFGGNIPIPTFAEADAARWEWNGERLVRI